MQKTLVPSSLELERFGLFPGEALVGEMTVLCRLAIDWSGEVKLLDNNTRSEVEVTLDGLYEFFGRPIRSTVGLDEHGQRLGDANSVRQLHQSPSGEFGVD